MLFCIDFDLTVTSEHTHNIYINPLINANKEIDAEGIYSGFQHVKTLGEEKDWKMFFETALNSGHQVAIVTFNKFEDCIKLYLARNIKLDKKNLEQIPIIAFLPEGYPRNNPNKNAHIAKAKEQLGLTEIDKGKVILIDDDNKNLAAAAKAGYGTIHANWNDIHVKSLLSLVQLQPKKLLMPSLAGASSSLWQTAAKSEAAKPNPPQTEKGVNAHTSGWRRKSCDVVLKEEPNVRKKMKVSV